MGIRRSFTLCFLCRLHAEDEKGSFAGFMTIGRIIRSALALTSLVIVTWAFWNVTARAIERRRAQHDRPIMLTILNWGRPAEDRIERYLVAAFEKENPRGQPKRITVGY